MFGWIIVLLLINPLIADSYGRIFLNLTFSFLMLSIIYSLSRKKMELIAGILLATPTIGLHWLFLSGAGETEILITTLFSTAFLGYSIFIMFRSIFTALKVEKELIFGAVSLYFLLGLLWAFLYVLVLILFPGSFRQEGLWDDSSLRIFQHFLYFSFVTLTTLGYGDIAPISAIARQLSILEAVIGQLYLATLVAGLVGAHLRVK